MKFNLLTAVVAGGFAALALCISSAANAQSNGATTGGAHPKSSYYRKAPGGGRAARRGGYSYQYSESINTYGDSRSLYGGASSLRDPTLDRQTSSGPFDHGFFFDSGVTSPNGGESPYMN